MKIGELQSAFSRESLLIVYGDRKTLIKDYGAKYAKMSTPDFERLRMDTAKKEAKLLSLRGFQAFDALESYKKQDKKDADALNNNIQVALSHDLLKKYVEYFSKGNDQATAYTTLLYDWKTAAYIEKAAKTVASIAVGLFPAGCGAEPLRIDEGRDSNGIVPTRVPRPGPTVVPTKKPVLLIGEESGIINLGEELGTTNYSLRLDGMSSDQNTASFSILDTFKKPVQTISMPANQTTSFKINGDPNSYQFYVNVAEFAPGLNSGWVDLEAYQLTSTPIPAKISVGGSISAGSYSVKLLDSVKGKASLSITDQSGSVVDECLIGKGEIRTVQPNTTILVTDVTSNSASLVAYQGTAMPRQTYGDLVGVGQGIAAGDYSLRLDGVSSNSASVSILDASGTVLDTHVLAPNQILNFHHGNDTLNLQVSDLAPGPNAPWARLGFYAVANTLTSTVIPGSVPRNVTGSVIPFGNFSVRLDDLTVNRDAAMVSVLDTFNHVISMYVIPLNNGRTFVSGDGSTTFDITVLGVSNYPDAAQATLKLDLHQYK